MGGWGQAAASSQETAVASAGAGVASGVGGWLLSRSGLRRRLGNSSSRLRGGGGRLRRCGLCRSSRLSNSSSGLRGRGESGRRGGDGLSSGLSNSSSRLRGRRRGESGRRDGDGLSRSLSDGSSRLRNGGGLCRWGGLCQSSGLSDSRGGGGRLGGGRVRRRVHGAGRDGGRSSSSRAGDRTCHGASGTQSAAVGL